METVAEMIYNTMTGQLEQWAMVPGVENAFSEGSACELLFSRIWEAGRRICKRLNVEEDMDLEIVMQSGMDIEKILCMKMFEYGVEYAKRRGG